MRRAIRRAGCGSSWGRAAAVAGHLEQGERGVVVLGDRRRVGGPAAEPRDRLGAPQRVGDRGAPVARVGDDLGRQRQRGRAQPRDPGDLLLEGDDGELGVLALARRERQREVALEHPGSQEQVGCAARRRGLRDLDERADRRGGEQPRALRHRVGVRAQARPRRARPPRSRRRAPRRRRSPGARARIVAARAHAPSARARLAARRAGGRIARGARPSRRPPRAPWRADAWRAG